MFHGIPSWEKQHKAMDIKKSTIRRSKKNKDNRGEKELSKSILQQ